ncbi:MAG: hypothetical protein Q7U31_08675, partial [Anaerolineaceae bacterium]|nr:hypothetical protein [Anaerolineaceae bacterium]
NLNELLAHGERLDLYEALKKLIKIRKQHPSFFDGAYRQLLLSNEQFAFSRDLQSGFAVTVINAADHAVSIDIPLDGNQTHYTDLMDETASYEAHDGHLYIEMPPSSAKWLMA